MLAPAADASPSVSVLGARIAATPLWLRVSGVSRRSGDWSTRIHHASARCGIHPHAWPPSAARPLHGRTGDTPRPGSRGVRVRPCTCAAGAAGEVQSVRGSSSRVQPLGGWCAGGASVSPTGADSVGAGSAGDAWGAGGVGDGSAVVSVASCRPADPLPLTQRLIVSQSPIRAVLSVVLLIRSPADGPSSAMEDRRFLLVLIGAISHYRVCRVQPARRSDPEGRQPSVPLQVATLLRCTGHTPHQPEERRR